MDSANRPDGESKQTSSSQEFPLIALAEAIYGEGVHRLLRWKRGRKYTVQSIYGYLDLFESAAVSHTPHSVMIYPEVLATSRAQNLQILRGGDVDEGFFRALAIYRSWLIARGTDWESVGRSQLELWRSVERWSEELGV